MQVTNNNSIPILDPKWCRNTHILAGKRRTKLVQLAADENNNLKKLEIIGSIYAFISAFFSSSSQSSN